MNRTPLSIISLTGTPVEIAYQLGICRRDFIAKRVEFWNQTLAKHFRGKRDTLVRLEKAFYREAKKSAPDYLEEILAIAEGCTLPFEEIFRLNLTELKPFAEKCSTVILPVTQDGKKSILIGHNEDWNPKQNDVFILKAKLPDMSYTIVAYDGYLPGLSCGINSHGLAHAINYVPPNDFRPGMPRIFITRHLVTAKNFEEVLNWIKISKRAFGQSIHMAQRKNYCGLELTAKKMVIRKAVPPLVHTNHYLEPSLFKSARPASENSIKRQEIAENILSDYFKKKKDSLLSRDAAKKLAVQILSDRTGFPYCIWREADTPKDDSATLVTALLQTENDKIEFFRESPAKSAPLVLQRDK